MKLMITCREAARITLQSEDRAAAFVDRFSARLHTRLCPNCRRFARQVQLMRQASARWRESTGED